jgi:WD40 repeat protein
VVDLGSKRLVATLPAADGALAEALAFLPGGTRLATGGLAGTVTVRDVRSGRVARRLRYPESVWATAVSPDGALIAALLHAEGGRESHVEVRDLRSGRRLFTRTLLPESAPALSFTRDGRTLVASSCCGGASAVIAWDARSGALRFRRVIPQKATALAMSGDARTLAVGTETGQLIALDARSGKQRGTATTVAGSPVSEVALSPDGEMVAVSPNNGAVTLWDVRSRRRVGDQFQPDPRVIPAVAFEPNGRLLITGAGGAAEWPVDVATLRRRACAIAGGDLTRDQWADILPTRPYRRVCGPPGRG